MKLRQPLWHKLGLHGILLGGSLLFLTPYVWLLGTSWKLDKEIQSEEFHLLPQAPMPRAVSPYVDERTFSIRPPEYVDADAWTTWIRAAAEDEIGRAVDAWLTGHPTAFAVQADRLRGELIEGVFGNVRAVLPVETWTATEPGFRSAVRDAVADRMISEAFDRCYRYFALGKVLLKDRNYHIYDLTDKQHPEESWRVTDGTAQIKTRVVSRREVAVVGYDFSGSDAFEIASQFKLPVGWEDFKRLSISFRRDQTWHGLTVLVEINGRLYRSRSEKYLSEDNFWEASFQLPGPDDQRLAAKLYVLLDEIERASRYDHGLDVLRLRVVVSRSSTPRALWAKGTENYKKVFEEVPFWRYLATSAFLAIANIAGTCLSCSLAAYAFARLRWPGRDLCFVLVLATLMIPPQVTMIPSFVIYRQLGWYNTLSPLWVPSWLAVNAFAIFLLRQAMRGLPRDLEDAATIDGCGYLRTYWHIALPLMRPTLAAISVFTFMYVWNDFMGPLIYVNDQRLYPAALGLFGFMAGRENQFTLIMAASVIMTLPVVMVFFLLQRYFIQGVALTGMKG
jgi:ABC-type glycerol-3-phosphate transport system permease component